jgi:hypothetical protein
MLVGSHQTAQVFWLDDNGNPAQVDSGTVWTVEPEGIIALAPQGRIHEHNCTNDPNCTPNTDGHTDGGDSTQVAIDAHQPGLAKLKAKTTSNGHEVKAEIEIFVQGPATHGIISAITNVPANVDVQMVITPRQAPPYSGKSYCEQYAHDTKECPPQATQPTPQPLVNHESIIVSCLEKCSSPPAHKDNPAPTGLKAEPNKPQ